MFEFLKKGWKIAEATELRREFEHLVGLARKAGLLENRMFYLAIHALIDVSEREQGQDIFTLPPERKKPIVDSLMKDARESWGVDMSSFAYGLVANALKASCLPGEDAEFVKRSCDEIFSKTIVACENCSQNLRLPAGKELMATCPECHHKFRVST